MKKLIYEDTESIKNRKLYAEELVSALNTVLSRFKSGHNHFGQPIEEKFAFELISNPLQTFDELLRANSPIKPIAGKPLDVEQLAKLTGLDRQGFINDFTVVLPGSVNRYNRKGTRDILKLKPSDRVLVSWKDDQFIINDQGLAAEAEMFRVYATTPEQIAELEHYENLCKALNAHLDKKDREFIDQSNIYQIAKRLGLQDPLTSEAKGRFVPNYKELARKVKTMTAS